jgi:repressor LexA
MAEPLTAPERRVYHYLIDFLVENTFQPSIRDIARKFRIKSTKTVSDLLHALAHKGYIQRDESRSRGVRILGFAAVGAVQPVPCYHRVRSSEPTPRMEDRVGYVTLDRRYLPTEDVFLLKVRGDGMTSRGIVDGDLALISPSSRAKDGDLVAARLGAEAVVRTIGHRGSTVVLESASPSDNPHDVTARDDYALLGVVCGIFRPFFEQERVREPEEVLD